MENDRVGLIMCKLPQQLKSNEGWFEIAHYLPCARCLWTIAVAPTSWEMMENRTDTIWVCVCHPCALQMAQEGRLVGAELGTAPNAHPELQRNVAAVAEEMMIPKIDHSK